MLCLVVAILPCLAGMSPQVASVVAAAREQAAGLSNSESPLSFSLVDGADAASALLRDHDAFVLDCDGVLWSGPLGLLPGATGTHALLQRLGKRCIYVTNNSARSRAQYAAKFAELGLDVPPEQIVPASLVAARWLASNAPDVSAAYVIGEAGLEAELRAAGIEPIRADRSALFDEHGFGDASPDPRVGAVVVGADHGFTFSALAGAALCLHRMPGCLFVATNPDDYNAVGQNRLPGTGCLVAAVEAAAGRRVDAVCGKPSANLARYLIEEYGLDPRRTVVVGDRLDTDVALAAEMGASSLLVLTGVASAQDAQRQQRGSATCPTAVASHLGALLAVREA
jgi:phosphoglycolate/pyridoxal phosphate phosphatase family enzyme